MRTTALSSLHLHCSSLLLPALPSFQIPQTCPSQSRPSRSSSNLSLLATAWSSSRSVSMTRSSGQLATQRTRPALCQAATLASTRLLLRSPNWLHTSAQMYVRQDLPKRSPTKICVPQKSPRTTLERVFVSGPEHAAVLVKTQGTSLSGVKLEDRACWICRIVDGKIKEVDNYCDTAAINQ